MDQRAEIINKRRERLVIRSAYLSLLARVVFIGLIAYLLLTQVFIITRAQGEAMFPSVRDGDLLIGYRLQKSFEKNDVLIYKQGGTRRIGRLIAQEEDVVDIDGGSLRVNEVLQTGDYSYATHPKEDGISFPYRLEEGQIFLLGDHRTQAYDSRSFGSLPRQAIEAKLITILRRRGL